MGMPQWAIERAPETLSARVYFDQRTPAHVDTTLTDGRVQPVEQLITLLARREAIRKGAALFCMLPIL